MEDFAKDRRVDNFGHNTEKWLVKTSVTLTGQGFDESLVKAVSLNFFCKWKSLKKALLGLWEFSSCQMGKQAK